MRKRFARGPQAEPRGGSIWILVGRRVRSRRTQLSLEVDAVAEELGVDPEVYERYEAGVEQMPAFVLSQIAELFGLPVAGFFDDVSGLEEPDGQSSSIGGSPQIYRIATAEERAAFLGEVFRKLDLEGQQHLLAIAGALSRCGLTSKARASNVASRPIRMLGSLGRAQRAQRTSKLQNSSRRLK